MNRSEGRDTCGLKCVSCRCASAARTPSSASGRLPSVAYAHRRLLKVCGFTCNQRRPSLTSYANSSYFIKPCSRPTTGFMTHGLLHNSCSSM